MYHIRSCFSVIACSAVQAWAFAGLLPQRTKRLVAISMVRVHHCRCATCTDSMALLMLMEPWQVQILLLLCYQQSGRMLQLLLKSEHFCAASIAFAASIS